MTFDTAVALLETGLRSALPGADAQARLAPVPRRAWPAGHNPARIRNAAGLLLIYPRSEETAETAENAEPKDGNAKHAKPANPDISLRVSRPSGSASDHAYIVLTVRAETLRHGGQVSLPGGVVDPGETFEQAALREAQEEIALPLDQVRVLGALTPLEIPVSGFRLHPIVGVNPTRPALTPSDGEVARILEVSIDELFDPKHFTTTERQRDGIRVSVPAFQVQGVEIWGATAMVLAEFLALLGWADAQTG